MKLSLAISLSILFLFLGIGTSVIFFTCFGIGDSWVIYPQSPLALICTILFVFCIFSTGSLAHSRRLQKRFENRFVRCIKCGYDLRASVGVCSECGTPIGP